MLGVVVGNSEGGNLYDGVAGVVVDVFGAGFDHRQYHIPSLLCGLILM